REIKLSNLGSVIRCKCIFLPRLPQQSLYRHHPSWQSTNASLLLILHRLGNPPSVHQNLAAVGALERRDDLITVLAFIGAWSDEHFLIMAEGTGCFDTAVFKLRDGGGVDGRWKRQRRTSETVFV